MLNQKWGAFLCGRLGFMSFTESILLLLIEILFLENDFWISHLRIWDAYYDHSTSGFVWEIETLADTASADGHQNSASVIFKNSWIISVHNLLVLLRNFWLSINRLMPLYMIEHSRVLPLFITPVHQTIRGKEDENTTRHSFGDSCYRTG